MKKNKLSIGDIATALNVSKTTVSFILNGKAEEKRISEQLIKKVRSYVEKVGYTPSHVAQSLRTGKTRILGLMVEDISNPFFASIAKYIEDRAYAHDCKIIYCSTENNDQRAKEFLRMFRNLNVDGYIITPTQGIEPEVKELIKSGEQVILFDRYFEKVKTNFVMVDNEQGTYKGTRHLVDQGYTNIAFITLDSEQPQMTGRLKGYRNAMKENKLKEHVCAIPFYVDATEFVRQIEKYLRKEKKLDAIVFGANYLGVSGIEAIRNVGLKIPNDLAVVSFDDNDIFRLHNPSITAISQPLEQISEMIITTLLDNINASDTVKKKDPAGIFLPTTMRIRESSSPKQG